MFLDRIGRRSGDNIAIFDGSRRYDGCSVHERDGEVLIDIHRINIDIGGYFREIDFGVNIS